jgi:mevalonate kinase
MWVKASAPGSLMLLGEYAVLEGRKALVCAVDKRITVFLSPRSDTEISVASRLGKFSCELSQIVVQPPFQFVFSAIKRFQKYFKTGCDITIESDFSSTVGLASSAAVTVATIAVLTEWFNIKFDSMQLIREARAIVQQVQGLGSGADVAACVLGGVVAYQTKPFFAEHLAHTFPITVVYSGIKTPTADVVRHVRDYFSKQPRLFQQIIRAIGVCGEEGVECVRQNNWLELGRIMNIQQGLMEALGVGTPSLNEIVEKLRHRSNILGAKISGSGLGDCVIALGTINEPLAFDHPGIQILSTSMASRGVECEKD